MEESKKLTKLIDFAIIVLNKVLPIINEKMANKSAEMLDFINTNNLIALKKKFSNWNEIVKNFTNFTTCLNNMIASNLAITYNRKSLKFINFVNNNIGKDFFQKKIDLLEKNIIIFLEMGNSLILSLKYFAENLDYIPKKNENDSIKSLSDIVRIINETLNKIEKSGLPKTKQELKELLQNSNLELNSGKKTGGSDGIYQDINELVSLQEKVNEFKIQGGYEKNNYYNIILGGVEPNVVISGFHVEHYIQSIFTKFELIKDDIKNNKNTDLNEFYEKIKPLASLSLNKLMEHILIESGAIENLFNEYISLAHNILPNLLNYYISKSNITNQSLSIEDEIVNLNAKINISLKSSDDNKEEFNISLSFDTGNISSSIKDLLKVLLTLIKKINNEDNNKIKNLLENTFELMNQIHSDEEFENIKKEVETAIPKIYNNKELFNKRESTKKEIIERIKRIENLFSLEPKIGKVNIPKFKYSSSDEGKLQELENIIQLLNILAPELKEIEIYYDSLAQAITDVIVKINYLISPKVKETCIKFPEFYNNIGLQIVLLEKLAKKRFNKSLNREFQDAKKELDNLFGFSIDKIYEDLNKS